VTESGIRDYADLKRVAAVVAHCLLVGESLLRQDDIAEATRALLGRGSCP
jgi:indole-3-glycerol phosphate synthase